MALGPALACQSVNFRRCRFWSFLRLRNHPILSLELAVCSGLQVVPEVMAPASVQGWGSVLTCPVKRDQANLMALTGVPVPEDQKALLPVSDLPDLRGLVQVPAGPKG